MLKEYSKLIMLQSIILAAEWRADRGETAGWARMAVVGHERGGKLPKLLGRENGRRLMKTGKGCEEGP